MKVLKLIAAQLVPRFLREEIKTLSHLLRDPYGFIDEDGFRDLLYAARGEQGIDMVSIKKINLPKENNLGVQ
jgi:hypothetical protein